MTPTTMARMVESKSRLLLTVYLAAASVVAASSVVYHHHESMPSDIYNADDDSPTTSTTPVVLLGVEATLNTSTHISDNGATRTELPEDVATRKASSEEATNVNGDVVVDVECGVWLALSTLEGAGLGMYAGVNFVKGQDLLIGGDSVIAITDIKQHNSNQDFTGDFLWDEYTWNAEALKMDLEGHVEVNVASEGFGAAANSFLPLYNVEEWYPRNTDIGLHRSKDAGAGASTVFHHRKSTANKDIAAGSELYVSYGENWFTSRSSLGPIPLTDDLESATAVLKKFTALEEDLHLRGIQKAAEIVLDVWTTFVQNTTFRKSRVLLGGFKHDDATDLNWLQSVHDSNVTAGRMASSQRSLEWLREFGTCGDHIVGQRSTLAQAGMGAFATRTLPRETVVAQLPMIHITDRARLNMYRLQRNGEGDLAPVDDTVTGHQLLLNYCYGHGESTMLLCPYGPLVNYVNHNQTLANVRLQWGKEFKGNHMPALLDDTVEKIENSDATAKLAMEFVALRVIQAGEEIFLDYGDDWEASWTAHVNGWSPVPNADKYVSAMQLESDNTTRLRTVYEEIREKTYSEHVVMMCDTACENEAEEVERHYKNGTLNEFLLENDASWWPCSVLRYRSIEGKSKNYISDSATNEEEYLYTIHLYKNDNGKMINNYLIKDVPRAIFHFVDKPYASDTFLPNAFRHDIRIPESIFPESWRNKRTQEDAVDSA